MEKSKATNKFKILKTILFSLLLVLSYVASVYVKGFAQTNTRLLYLLVFVFLGFCSFYIVYYIIYFITNLKYKRQDKKKKEFIVNCDDSVSNFLKDEKYKFTYNVKNSIKDNIESAVSVAKNVILDVATINDKNNKYFYLNYTVYDALEIYGNLVTFAYAKIDGVFKTFKIQNKPISFIEKSLQNVIVDDKGEKVEEKDNLLIKIKKGVGNAVLNTGIFLFKNKIQDAVNEIISVICLEAFKVYGKDVKSTMQALEQEIEVQNA